MTLWRQLIELLRSSALAGAFATTTIGALFASFALRRLMGDFGFGAIMVGLCVLGVAILVARRDEWRLLHLVPTTLLLLLGWLLVSVLWSHTHGASLAGWTWMAGLTLLGIIVAQFRDTVQIVRHTGDALRFLLTLSLAVEILSGILFDAPFTTLGVRGAIATGGPIQGVFGTGTRLGFVAIVAFIVFLVEWRTRSVTGGRALYSVALAAGLIVFTASPIVAVLAGIALLATATLVLVRRIHPPTRTTVQWALAALLLIAAVLVYTFRRPLVYLLNAEPDFLTRSRLWNMVLDISAYQPITGWGWVGSWPGSGTPYDYIRFALGHVYSSASNAWMDMLLQAGAVGVILLVGFAVLALARAWMLASERRSTVYTWPALVLVVILADSVVTSSMLSGAGWFLVVLCAATARQSRSWRARLSPEPDVPALGGELS